MSTIEHVSDTALLVAAFRAMENARPDGLLRDPFAAALAGEKGIAIAQSSPVSRWMGFGIGVRSRFVDEFVLKAVHDAGIGTVANLGAGLDTRPWRLDGLPAGLRWIEVDFPEMLDYKSSRLAGHEPRCILERVSADLTNASDRARVFAAIGVAPTLMITEGLLMYLPRETVSALAFEAAAHSGVRNWILDISAFNVLRWAHGDLTPNIESVRAKDALEGGEVLDGVTAQGWRITDSRLYARDGSKLGMQRAAELLTGGPPPAVLSPNDPSGVYLLAHGAGE